MLKWMKVFLWWCWTTEAQQKGKMGELLCQKKTPKHIFYLIILIISQIYLFFNVCMQSKGNVLCKSWLTN